MRNDNLKKTGQLRNVWVEFGFGTVCCSRNRWSKERRSISSFFMTMLLDLSSKLYSLMKRISVLQKNIGDELYFCICNEIH